MTNYFSHCSNLDELKKAYKAAAIANHPDIGGNTATMQAINAEYQVRFEILKRSQNEQAAEDTSGKTQATTESAADFINIIDHLLRMSGLEVELCGRWLWIGGNTKAHKEELKACGCRWSNAKKLWSWHYAEEGARYRTGHTSSMSDIRSKYGSQRFNSSNTRADSLPA